MKRFFFPGLILASSLFFSCASAGLGIPGESKIILKNLAVEYNTIADGYFDNKRYDKAIEYYKLAMRNEELYLPVYYKLARSYALAKNWEPALESYNFLLNRDPDNIMLKTSLAYIKAMKGDVDEAILNYKTLYDENPNNESLLENYVALLINVGRGEDAEENYFLLKEKFPDNAQLSSFTQKLNDMIDNFDPDKKKAEPAEKNPATDSASEKK
ncbi:MAG: tetratricopeptide repeat protein [Treponema sp.]|nr:tetratricopeptide repeat protein [Candidatus Treponema equifaecale]